jgi:hypothetical protein
MLDGFLGEQCLDFLTRAHEGERRLHDAIEDEGEIDKQHEACNLEPLERLPTKAKRNNPDEKRTACVDGRT